MPPPTLLDDKEFRLTHAYEIVDKGGRRHSLDPNPVQQRLMASTARRKMVLKARQVGISTVGLLDIYDDTVTTPNTTSVIIAHEQDAIRKLFRIPQRAFRFSDPELKPVIDRGGGSKYEMYFPLINSRIYCDLEVRGDTAQNLHISEMAFIKDQDKIKATLQAVPLGGKVTCESTANGIGGLFYDMWQDPDQPYEKFFFPWFLMPEYQIPLLGKKLTPTREERAFVKKAKKEFGVDIRPEQLAFRRFKQIELRDLFPQEYPEDDQTCFLASGARVMNAFKLKELMEKARKPYRVIERDGARIVLFRPYNNARLYACGVDVAEGVNKDWSIGSMFDVSTREEVGVIAAHGMKPGDFAHSLAGFCELFMERERPHPLLGVERNNHGHTVLYVLDQELYYPNLYHRPQGEDRDERPGWVTDKVTRPVMMDTFVEAVEDDTAVLNDRVALQECLTLVNNEGKIEAAEGKHDDRVIAAAIALQMVIESSPSQLYDNIKARIRV